MSAEGRVGIGAGLNGSAELQRSLMGMVNALDPLKEHFLKLFARDSENVSSFAKYRRWKIYLSYWSLQLGQCSALPIMRSASGLEANMATLLATVDGAPGKRLHGVANAGSPGAEEAAYDQAIRQRHGGRLGKGEFPRDLALRHHVHPGAQHVRAFPGTRKHDNVPVPTTRRTGIAVIGNQAAELAQVRGHLLVRAAAVDVGQLAGVVGEVVGQAGQRGGGLARVQDQAAAAGR